MSETSSGTESSTGGECLVGSEDCACTPGGFCDGELVCVDSICAPPEQGGDGDGDGPGDGDGDAPGDGDGDVSGDGDGDPVGNVCTQAHIIEVDAIDASEHLGWEVTESMLGEGTILAWDNQTEDASVRFDLAVPCDDFWHLWVRGNDNGNADSFFVAVDGAPDPLVVFELDCTASPDNSAYVWRELNYREPDAGPCEVVEDPWVQAWDAGFHSLRLDYRESIALSKIYLTNTETPPE